MRSPVVSLIFLSACVLSTAAPLKAQQPVPTPQAAQATAPAPQRTPIPLKIEVVLMRFKGTEKIASMPYSLLVLDGTRAMLRLGSSVPVPQSTLGPSGSATSYSYSDVGVSIDVNVSPTADGRFRVTLLIEDSSLGEGVTVDAASATKLPVIRRYRLDTQVLVRDGQSTEFNVASDKVTGETIRAQVTMTVLK